jgi:hypothetical protein
MTSLVHLALDAHGGLERWRRFEHVSCVTDELLESELFGFERGAFTGAQQSKPGQIELAAGGVLFLDEVTEMTPAAQAKFLRVLQSVRSCDWEPAGPSRSHSHSLGDADNEDQNNTDDCDGHLGAGDLGRGHFRAG